MEGGREGGTEGGREGGRDVYVYVYVYVYVHVYIYIYTYMYDFWNPASCITHFHKWTRPPFPAPSTPSTWVVATWRFLQNKGLRDIGVQGCLRGSLKAVFGPTSEINIARNPYQEPRSSIYKVEPLSPPAFLEAF